MRLVTLAFLLLALPACGDDGAGDAPDASGVDAAPRCELEPAAVTCTVGDDSPCTAVCAEAYCHNFEQLGVVCTQDCTTGVDEECPEGWRCNNMGRCRPPG